MKFQLSILLATQAAEGFRQRRLGLRKGPELRRLLEKDQRRIANLSPRVLSSCDLKSQSDINLMETFAHWDPEDQKFEYFSDDLHVANTVQGVTANVDDDVTITSGNGWCDVGVYKSWNKCNINGECFESCTDGLCYTAHKNQDTRIVVPSGCSTWYKQCAQECADDSECAAFSFLDTNILGHAEYTCNFMKSLTCTYDGQNQGDPRSSFHVKGSHLQQLFEDYNVDRKGLLDAKLAQDPDFVFGHWTSWGYHNCKRTDGRTCGEGLETRKRTNSSGQLEKETRECDFRDDDGNLLVCEDIVEEAEETIGHGWTNWGQWTSCSKSCGSNGSRQRARNCATCSNPNGQGLCSADKLANATPSDFVPPGSDFAHCPKNAAKDIETCNQGKCLPFTNGQGFKLKKGWALNPNRTVKNNINNWLGRCTNYENTAYKKMSLAMSNNNNAFTHCMKICQEDEKNDCLAVSFFPKTGSNHGVNWFYGTRDGNEEFNCYLFNTRCHEDDSKFTNSFNRVSTNQDNAQAWYAFKDLCSGTRLCDSWGQYMKSICDSSGANAFPNMPNCQCPGTSDHNSQLRIFGRALGFEFFNSETGKFAMRRSDQSVPQRAPFYSERKYNNNWSKATGGLDYQTAYQQNAIGCHDPCAHNKCDSSAKCVINTASTYGYDCICEWPTAPDAERFGPGLKDIGLAGMSWENGCKAVEFRNIDSSFKDNMILYGGGWNAQRDPVDKKLVKPYYGYYGLEATENPWKFKVRNAAQKIPAPDRSAHKGKFYNCMMNIAENEVMVLGGRPGQFFDKWDDKTFVYSWGENAQTIADEGKWIGITGDKMDETVEGCKAYGDAGCMRVDDWPDLPSTPLFECKGQCRDGASGKGPTDPRWVHQYCIVKGEFWTGSAFVEREFNLCRAALVKLESDDDREGVKINGLSGEWVTEEIDDTTYENTWKAYIRIMKTTVRLYRNRLEASDIGSHSDAHLEFGNKLRYDRWKMRLPQDLYSPIVGPVDHSDMPQVFNYITRNGYTPNFMKAANREYHAPGQPICGVMGSRAYIGSGKFARLMSLAVDKTEAAKEKVWTIETDSQFPEMYKRTNNERCLSPQQWNANGDALRYDPLPAYRQNFGTVTTTEGMWMIGGLIAPSADLKGRLLNRKYNVEGCTKQAHLDDVWVFNPRGWSRSAVLGEAADLYDGKSDTEILPKRMGYTLNSIKHEPQDQSFSDFRLSDEAGPNNLTIEKAIEEGWECTGIQGKWCRKPFIPRNTKGAESTLLCFEPAAGTENLNAFRRGEDREIPKRPRTCSVDETNDPNNNCICYIINISGQSGLKQSPGGSGFRPEIDYLEVRRADGTWGSDKAIYNNVDEYCPDATEPYPGIDDEYVSTDESAVADFTQCTSECGGDGQPACNRSWRTKNLRRKWHEAGRVKHPRMGFLAGVLKGEIVIWGGECFGPAQIRQWNLDGTLRMTRSLDQPRSCKIQMKPGPDGSVRTINDDYIEAFSFIRMNKAGYLFGERRYVELDGYYVGQAGHGEAAVSQQYSTMNTNLANFS